jgi:hypothetical protein
MARFLSIVLVPAALVSCTTEVPAPPMRCGELGAVVSPSTPIDRKVLGGASLYEADATARMREDELVSSQRARRELAWSVVEKVFTSVPTAEPTPAGTTLPRFRTWYDRDDVTRIFQRLYERAGRERRNAHAPFTEAELDEAFGWNPHAVEELEAWPETRIEEYIAGLDGEHEVAGLAGIRSVGMNGDVARHVVASYPEILDCMANGAPPAFDDGPPEETRRMHREVLALAECEGATRGPFAVARGETLVARIEADAAASVVRVIDADENALCEMEGACEVSGPGIFTVQVIAGTHGLSAPLEIEYTAPDPEWAGCLSGAFPLASATVRAQWRRADVGWSIPTFDTSAAGMAARMDPAGTLTWGDGDGELVPSSDAIYTAQLPAGSSFWLAGLHIKTRELDHWVYITLWWSPDPDTDFGADRPDSIRALGGPWSSYKMCTSVMYDERDPDPRGGFDGSLGDALAAVHGGEGGPSWCSNPYLDAGPRLARSNCIGCHQHALSGVRPAEVPEEGRFPDDGRSLVRNNFPADYFWGIDGGDDLGQLFADVAEWWAAADR